MLAVLGTARPSYLVLAPACVFLLVVIAWQCCAPLDPLNIVLVLLGALAAHISVNAFNEYSDFKSGLDQQAERTPFSGGSGTLVARPELLGATLSLAMATLFLVVLVGAWFLYQWGLALLPVGLLGVVIIVVYTDQLTRSPLACLIASGLGFGPLMICGGIIALTGELSASGLWASVPVFFVVNNLLLVSQIPDIAADRAVGRRTLPVIYGKRTTAWVYLLFVCLAGLFIVTPVLLGVLPVGSLLGLLAIAAALPVSIALFRYADNIPKLLPFMALNVGVAIFTPVMIALGCIFTV